jgi:hypothetical protein
MKSVFPNISSVCPAALMVFSPFTLLLGGETPGPDIKTPPLTTVAVIRSPLQDGTLSEPPPPVQKPHFQIESTRVSLLDVVESPPMPGLPPVEGTITLKVRSVADPGLADPPPRSPPRLAEDPQVLEHLSETGALHRQSRVAFVSAQVYDRSRTLLTCYPNGGLEKAVKAWSNLDFNHFSGFATFEATGGDGEVRDYSLLMGIHNENTRLRREFLSGKGIAYEEPEIPALPDGPPSFVILSETADPEAVTLLEDLHALYRVEGVRMAEACAAREKAYEERRAHLLANPPKPKDVTVHFWKREKTAATPEGGQP